MWSASLGRVSCVRKKGICAFLWYFSTSGQIRASAAPQPRRAPRQNDFSDFAVRAPVSATYFGTGVILFCNPISLTRGSGHITWNGLLSFNSRVWICSCTCIRALTIEHQSLWRTPGALHIGDPVHRCQACRSLPERVDTSCRAR